MDMNKLQEKYQKLLSYLKELDSVAIAFSGGVDSTFLLAAAKEALGDKVIALTAKSCLFPERESGEAEDFCKNLGVEQIVLDLGDTELPAFKHNPPNRCYICKKGLFEKFLQKAKEYQMSYVAEGSNMDDLGDYRPKSGNFPNRWDSQPGANHPLPASLPALYTERPSPPKNFPW